MILIGQLEAGRPAAGNPGFDPAPGGSDNAASRHQSSVTFARGVYGFRSNPGPRAGGPHNNAALRSRNSLPKYASIVWCRPSDCGRQCAAAASTKENNMSSQDLSCWARTQGGGQWAGQCPLLACAVQRRRFLVGVNPTRQPLQPEATGAGMEVTKMAEASV